MDDHERDLLLAEAQLQAGGAVKRRRLDNTCVQEISSGGRGVGGVGIVGAAGVYPSTRAPLYSCFLPVDSNNPISPRSPL
jgi:hypothetical protein